MNTSSSLIKTPLETELKESYLGYSLAAIQRAIPDYRDGLIPIHRRIIWGSYKAGFSSDSTFKKCARLDGEITGKYSPHGSSYGSIVTLASKWNNNYPLIDGHGNFGSSTDGPASSRYTECKLSKFTEEVLLSEVDNLELKDNYDGSRKEPVFLNAKLPVLLLKGITAIAVGYAVNIPQYNLEEIISFLEKPKGKLLPDFPSGPKLYYDKERPNSIIQKAIITSKKDLIVGSRKKKEYIIVEFSNLPYGTNPEKIGKQIKSLTEKDSFPQDGIISMEDLSDRTGDCISVTIKKSDYQSILDNLYTYTDLKSNFSINFTVLIDGIPQTLTPEDYLILWRKWRLNQIEKNIIFLRDKLESDRRLYLDLIKVFRDRENLIKILKNESLTVDQCMTQIEKFYKILQSSVKYLINLPIRKLATEEVSSLEKNLFSTEKLIEYYNDSLNNLEKYFISELRSLKKNYLQKRKSSVEKEEIEDIRKKINYSNESKTKNYFSIDKNSGKKIKGTTYSEPVFCIASNGLIYRVTHTTKQGYLTERKIKIFSVIPESDKPKILEIIDETNNLKKYISTEGLSATSKGSNLGFNNITKVNELPISKKDKLKISTRTSKPKKYVLNR